jgi:hypothetical protein
VIDGREFALTGFRKVNGAGIAFLSLTAEPKTLRADTRG